MLKIWGAVYIFNTLAMTVGPFPDGVNLDDCLKIAQERQTEVEQKFDAGVKFPRVEGIDRDLKKGDVLNTCIVSEKRPELGSSPPREDKS